MKTKFLLIFMCCLNLSYGGTPSSSDAYYLFGIIILIFGCIIGIPYLFKYIRNKINHFKQSKSENPIDGSSEAELP